MNTNTHQLCTEEQRRELCRLMTAAQEKEWLDDWTRQSTNIETTDLREMGCGATIHTGFRAVDARDSNLDFQHITEPLLFVTCIVGGVHGATRIYWPTYEHAMIGHKYWVVKHIATRLQEYSQEVRESYGRGYQLTDRYEHAAMDLHNVALQLSECESILNVMASIIGASSIEDLMRSNCYIPLSKRLPIVLPVDGYPCDIERFIRL